MQDPIQTDISYAILDLVISNPSALGSTIEKLVNFCQSNPNQVCLAVEQLVDQGEHKAIAKFDDLVVLELEDTLYFKFTGFIWEVIKKTILNTASEKNSKALLNIISAYKLNLLDIGRIKIELLENNESEILEFLEKNIKEDLFEKESDTKNSQKPNVQDFKSTNAGTRAMRAKIAKAINNRDGEVLQLAFEAGRTSEIAAVVAGIIENDSSDKTFKSIKSLLSLSLNTGEKYDLKAHVIYCYALKGDEQKVNDLLLFGNCSVFHFNKASNGYSEAGRKYREGYYIHLLSIKENEELPTQEEILKLNKIPILIKYNEEFYIFGISEEKSCGCVKLDSNKELQNIDFEKKSEIYVSNSDLSEIYEEIKLKKGHVQVIGDLALARGDDVQMLRKSNDLAFVSSCIDDKTLKIDIKKLFRMILNDDDKIEILKRCLDINTIYGSLFSDHQGIIKLILENIDPESKRINNLDDFLKIISDVKDKLLIPAILESNLFEPKKGSFLIDGTTVNDFALAGSEAMVNILLLSPVCGAHRYQQALAGYLKNGHTMQYFDLKFASCCFDAQKIKFDVRALLSLIDQVINYDDKIAMLKKSLDSKTIFGSIFCDESLAVKVLLICNDCKGYKISPEEKIEILKDLKNSESLLNFICIKNPQIFEKVRIMLSQGSNHSAAKAISKIGLLSSAKGSSEDRKFASVNNDESNNNPDGSSDNKECSIQ